MSAWTVADWAALVVLGWLCMGLLVFVLVCDGAAQ